MNIGTDLLRLQVAQKFWWMISNLHNWSV